MPIPSGIQVVPLQHRAGFGAEVFGANVNELTDADFLVLEEALYVHKLIVIRDQGHLDPAKQWELNKRFDPDASGQHGHGTKEEVLNKKFKGKQNLTLGFPSVPGVDMVRLVGCGTFAPGHYGTTETLTLRAGDHSTFHKSPLTKEQQESGLSRFNRWHIDAQLFPKENHTARVTSIWAHTLPKGPDVKVQFDDGSGQTATCEPGKTAFMNGASIFESLSAEDKAWVEHSFVEYAPSPYEWIINCKGENNGFSILSEGLEQPLEDLPGDESQVQILPMVWVNPGTGEKAFQVHQIVARKIHVKHSAGGETVRVIDDLVEVRETINRLQRPFLKEENILFSPQKEGDLVVWYNRGLRHSPVEYPNKAYGPRMMHQCHLQGSDSVASPNPPSYIKARQAAAASA